ncbi:MAG: gerKB2 [Firmicutes bacterium]|nr:gerKB2 [Bacillota bacterium]
MSRHIQMSGGLFACMMCIFSYTAAILLLPSALFKLAGQSAWVAVVLGAAAGGLIGLFAVYVALRNPRMSAAQSARYLMGKWLGGAVGLLYAGFFIWIYALSLRQIVDFVQIMLLPGTPNWVIAALMAIVVLYGVWEGIEVTARVAFQALVAITVAVLALPMLVYPEIRATQVEPFLWRGMPAVYDATWLVVPWFGESMIALTFVQYLKNRRLAYRWFLVGLGMATFLLTLLVALGTLVFGPDLPGRFVFPVYMVIQQISVARFIERIEVVLIMVWLSGMFIKLSMCQYASAEAISHAFGLGTHRWPAVVMAVVGVLITEMFKGTLDAFHLTTSPVYVLTTIAIEVGIPLVLLIASLLRSASQRKESPHA